MLKVILFLKINGCQLINKDDYSDDQFDRVIRNCDYNAAWFDSNFKLWILSHLKRVTKYISKDDILKE